MKKLLYFSFIFLLINSCSIKEKPVFTKIDNIKITSLSSDTIRLKAEAFFENPNDLSGKISTDEIKVIVNGTEVAQVFSNEFDVPARKEFVIPLQVVIPASQVFENNKNGIIGGLINSILNKSISVAFKGTLKYKVLGFSSEYPIDATEDIKF